MGKTLTPQNLGEKNKKAIIELLRSRGSLSRADISRALNLSFPTVSSHVNYLLENDYVNEIGEGTNTLGRKSTLIGFNARKGLVVGLDLGRSLIRLKISDLLGNSLITLSNKVDRQNNGNSLVNRLNALIAEAVQQCGISMEDIMCVGVGIPGVLDKESGKMILVPYATGWDHINIQDELTQIFDCPIVIENSVNLGAVGEVWKGCGRKFRNLVYINYGVGIGSALIINGSLCTGKNGIAGEIGYAVASPECILKEYNVEGSLEQLISGNSIDMELRQSQLGISSLSELFEMDSAEAAEKRNVILHKIEMYFGVVLINLASILNPEAIILSGGIGTNVGKLLIPRWEKMLETNLPVPPKLICSKMKSEENVYGAIRYALENIDDAYCSWG
ncbi:MAG: ROK family transcriptional regulator [Caldicoprobacterales bacterium]|jgi:predicted NBD/HSP70 family sugar kinase|nr:ROK family transcriptional regulator [Clostridiales bacterium]